MKIAIVNANNGLPVNGETTVSYHICRILETLGHDVEIIAISGNGKPKKYDTIFPDSMKVQHQKYRTANLSGFDRVVLNSVPYDSAEKTDMLGNALRNIPFSFLLHGYVNFDTMNYGYWNLLAKKTITMDKRISNLPNSMFSLAPYYSMLRGNFGEAAIAGDPSSDLIIAFTRLSFTKNPTEVKKFITENPKYRFILYGTSSSDSGMVHHKYFKELPNVSVDNIQEIEAKFFGYSGAKFTLDLQKYTLHRGGMHYAALESCDFGVVPIFNGAFVDFPINGIDASLPGYSLEISVDEYQEITRKNKALLEQHKRPLIIDEILR